MDYFEDSVLAITPGADVQDFGDVDFSWYGRAFLLKFSLHS